MPETLQDILVRDALFRRSALPSLSEERSVWPVNQAFLSWLREEFGDVNRRNLDKASLTLRHWGLRAVDEARGYRAPYQPLIGQVHLVVSQPQLWERRKAEATPNPLGVRYSRSQIAAAQSHGQDADIELFHPPDKPHRPFQRYAVHRGLEQAGILLADDPRQGKTAQAFGLIGAAKGDIQRVLVVAPGPAKGEWADQSKEWLEHPLPVYNVEPSTGWNVPNTGPALVLVHYDAARPWRKDATRPWTKDIFSRMRDEEWDLVVLDEAHHLKNRDALQTIGILGGQYTVGKGIDAAIQTAEPIRARHRWALTGTVPVEKDPANLYPILRWLEPQVWGTTPEAERAFNNRYTQYEASLRNPAERRNTPVGAKNERELQDILLSSTMLRRQERTPPPVRNTVKLVPESAAEWRAIELARAAEQEALIDEAAQAGLTVQGYESLIDAAGRKVSIPFQRMSAVNAETALAKARRVAEYAAEAAQEEPVLVYSSHVEPVKVISRRLDQLRIPHFTLTGEIPAEQRRLMVKRFNEGERQAIVSTLASFAEGLSAARANRVIFGGLDWTPATIRQAESRVKTATKTEPIRVDTIVLEDSIDSNIVRKLHEKQEQERHITGLGTGGQITRSARAARDLAAVEAEETANQVQDWVVDSDEDAAPDRSDVARPRLQRTIQQLLADKFNIAVPDSGWELMDRWGRDNTAGFLVFLEDKASRGAHFDYDWSKLLDEHSRLGAEDWPSLPERTQDHDDRKTRVLERIERKLDQKFSVSVPPSGREAMGQWDLDTASRFWYYLMDIPSSDDPLAPGDWGEMLAEFHRRRESGEPSPSAGVIPHVGPETPPSVRGDGPEAALAAPDVPPVHLSPPGEDTPVVTLPQPRQITANTEAAAPPIAPPESPPDAPQVPGTGQSAPLTPASPPDVEEPLFIGPVSTDDRARVARDDCPIPDGDACVTIMRPDELYTDAKTFQYKEATDTDGVSVKLQDVKQWDPDLAGVAYVWERADGRRFIVDGHQRLALAKRMQAEGQDPALLVKFWREVDGFTPRYMRLVAAKKNIAEDSGTAVDAARVLREDPNLFDTLSQSGAKVRDAKGLAKLSLPMFNEAVEYINAGRVPENVAAVVSRVGENEEMQRGVLSELVRAQRDSHLTPDEAGQLVYVVRRSMLDSEAQKLQGLMPGFDVGAVRESAWRERDALTRGVLNAFKGTRLVLRAVERGETKLEDLGNVLASEANSGELDAAQKSIAIIEVLAESRGPLADFLDYQSKKVKGRMDADGITRRRAVGPFVTQAVDYLRPFLEGYLDDNGETLRADLQSKGFTVSRQESFATAPGPTMSSTTSKPPAPVRSDPGLATAKALEVEPPQAAVVTTSAGPASPDQHDEIVLFAAPMTDEQSRRVGSGLEEEEEDAAESIQGPAAPIALIPGAEGPVASVAPAGQQANLGNDFATNAQVDMVMPSFGQGDSSRTPLGGSGGSRPPADSTGAGDQRWSAR